MSLQLNEPRSEYQEFYGTYNKEMPKLIANGRTPLSVADIMRRRVEVANSNDPQLRSAWLDNYFDTSDGIAYHPNGKAKVVLDAVPLRTITPQDALQSGARSIDAATYYRLPGEDIRTTSLTTSMPVTKRAAMSNPIWNDLARGDKALLREYTSLVFSVKQRFGYDQNMGIYLSVAPETPALRAWIVDSFNNWSDLVGMFDLDSGNARLVGVAPARPAKVSR